MDRQRVVSVRGAVGKYGARMWQGHVVGKEMRRVHGTLNSFGGFGATALKEALGSGKTATVSGRARLRPRDPERRKDVSALSKSLPS